MFIYNLAVLVIKSYSIIILGLVLDSMLLLVHRAEFLLRILFIKIPELVLSF